MLNEILDYLDKIQKVLTTIHFDLIVQIILNLVILGIIFKAIDVFENNLKKKFNENKNSQIVKFIPALTRIIKFVIFFILVAALLQNHGYSISSLVAGFGITGLAVGFAANATIANLFGTIAILSDKSFEVGDYIKIGAFEGTVEDINMRSTKIRTLDNALTIIPQAFALSPRSRCCSLALSVKPTSLQTNPPSSLFQPESTQLLTRIASLRYHSSSKIS